MRNLQKIAVVTGANKGIGFAIVKQLSHLHENLKIYLTARNSILGQEAHKKLSNCSTCEIYFHQLDIEDEESIARFVNFLRERHPNGVDILVNNAGVLLDVNHRDSTREHFVFDKANFKQTIRINSLGTLKMIQAFSDILTDTARIVNLSSGMGSVIFSFLTPQIQQRFEICSTLEESTELIDDIMNSVDHIDEWLSVSPTFELWPNFCLGRLLAYGLSKLAIQAITTSFHLEFAKQNRKSIAINSCCPGSVMTDLNKLGSITPEQGAEIPVYLASLPVGTPLNGKFLASGKEQNPFQYKPEW